MKEWEYGIKEREGKRDGEKVNYRWKKERKIEGAKEIMEIRWNINKKEYLSHEEEIENKKWIKGRKGERNEERKI